MPELSSCKPQVHLIGSRQAIGMLIAFPLIPSLPLRASRNLRYWWLPSSQGASPILPHSRNTRTIGHSGFPPSLFFPPPQEAVAFLSLSLPPLPLRASSNWASLPSIPPLLLRASSNRVTIVIMAWLSPTQKNTRTIGYNGMCALKSFVQVLFLIYHTHFKQ